MGTISVDGGSAVSSKGARAGAAGAAAGAAGAVSSRPWSGVESASNLEKFATSSDCGGTSVGAAGKTFTTVRGLILSPRLATRGLTTSAGASRLDDGTTPGVGAGRYPQDFRSSSISAFVVRRRNAFSVLCISCSSVRIPSPSRIAVSTAARTGVRALDIVRIEV
jgi:hypothetical protein